MRTEGAVEDDTMHKEVKKAERGGGILVGEGGDTTLGKKRRTAFHSRTVLQRTVCK